MAEYKIRVETILSQSFTIGAASVHEAEEMAIDLAERQVGPAVVNVSSRIRSCEELSAA